PGLCRRDHGYDASFTGGGCPRAPCPFPNRLARRASEESVVLCWRVGVIGRVPPRMEYFFFVWVGFAFAVGAAVGSCLNVCIYRIPYEKSLLWPGSRCGHCFQPVRWYDNLPLVRDAVDAHVEARSEEHTSELQSQSNL